jgi:hypothetical protein
LAARFLRQENAFTQVKLPGPGLHQQWRETGEIPIEG